MAGEYESVELVEDRYVERLAMSAVVAALMAAFSYVVVPYPFSPTDITLQTMGVAIAGLVLGPVWGGFSMSLYVLVGALGAPVFKGGAAGMGHLFGPTGGFVFGFIAAAVVTGAIVHRDLEPKPLESVSLPLVVAGLLAGMVATYAVGVPWLANQYGLSLVRAADVGAIVFVPGDLVKLGAALGLVRAGEFALE
jgi:biotin transport system substrate-specific component